MRNLHFYMTPGSCSTGIHILLEELEEVFEVTIVNLPAGDHLKPAYLAINPKATVPALVRRDGSVLTEVPAIAFWLAQSHPGARLWPADPDGQALAMEVMAHVATTLHGQGFARIFVPGSFSRDAGGQAAAQALGREIVERGFAVLEKKLPQTGYIAGAFSAADAVLFYVEFWADKTRIALPPALAQHYRLMLTRPAVLRVLREEGYNPALLGQFETGVAA